MSMQLSLIPTDPEFETDRLHIERMRLVHQSHIDALNDKLYMAYSDQRHYTHTYASQWGYVKQQQDDIKFLLLDLQLADDRKTSVGSISVHFSPPNQRVDMGLLIVPSFAGQGYGIEAWRGTMKYLFAHGVHKVEAGTPEPNKAMIRIMYGTKMRLEGERRDSFLLDNGERAKILLYGKSK